VSNSNVQPIWADDRQSMRNEVCLPALIEAGPGNLCPVTILNVSAHGAMVEAAVHFVPGRPVTIDLGRVGRVAGRIAWTREGHSGVVFATPLTLAQFETIV
jgi:PilZ domain